MRLPPFCSPVLPSYSLLAPFLLPSYSLSTPLVLPLLPQCSLCSLNTPFAHSILLRCSLTAPLCSLIPSFKAAMLPNLAKTVMAYSELEACIINMSCTDLPRTWGCVLPLPIKEYVPWLSLLDRFKITMLLGTNSILSSFVCGVSLRRLERWIRNFNRQGALPRRDWGLRTLYAQCCVL